MARGERGVQKKTSWFKLYLEGAILAGLGVSGWCLYKGTQISYFQAGWFMGHCFLYVLVDYLEKLEEFKKNGDNRDDTR